MEKLFKTFQNMLKMSKLKNTIEGSSFIFESEKDYNAALTLLSKISFAAHKSSASEPSMFAWSKYIFEHVKTFVPDVSESEFLNGEVELARDDIKLFFKSFDKSKFKLAPTKDMVLFKADPNLGLFVDTTEDPETAMLSIINEYFVDDTQVTFYSSPKFKNIFIGAFPESYSINIF